MNKPLPLAAVFFSSIAVSRSSRSAPLPALAESPLADAVENGRRDAAYGLIHQDGIDVNAAQGDGTTALHWAAYQLDAALVGELLSHGAKANTQNRYGASPLGEAVKAANAEIVEMLLAAGANVGVAERGRRDRADARRAHGLRRRREQADRRRRRRQRARGVARSDGADVGRRRRVPGARRPADRARRRRARARRRERLGLADHERAARAVPPDGRPHAAAVRRALGLRRVRALDPRRRRGRRPADARRRHAADARDRQLRVRHREGAARRRREPAPLGLVGPHGALSRRRHEHLRAARRRRAGALEEHDGHGPRRTRCSPPASR